MLGAPRRSEARLPSADVQAKGAPWPGFRSMNMTGVEALKGEARETSVVSRDPQVKAGLRFLLRGAPDICGRTKNSIASPCGDPGTPGPRAVFPTPTHSPVLPPGHTQKDQHNPSKNGFLQKHHCSPAPHQK